ncbi:hypothetical protein [Algiphilus sp.]|uniref:hypothetical protein n=1 Tax=Algiphilus sp. TaxID=1872431 RepID=UPI0032EAC9D7
MIARIRTRFACTADALWEQIMQPRSLVFVAAPILVFVSADGGRLPARWEEGVSYPLRLFFLGLLPLGRHTIRLVQIDADSYTILSEEHGQLARVWNHRIHFREVAPGQVFYSDEIDIRAGLLTPFIWWFAHLFYRHRQRRWKQWLRRAVREAPRA